MLSAIQITLTNARFNRLNRAFCDDFVELEKCLNGVITGNHVTSSGVEVRKSGLLFSALMEQMDSHKVQIATSVSLIKLQFPTFI